MDYENSPKGITAQNKGERIIDCTLLEMKYVFRAEVKKNHEISRDYHLHTTQAEINYQPHNFVVRKITLECASNRAAQLCSTEPHTPCAEMILDCASNRVQEIILDYEVIKLHNFVVQSYNELLILDCASNRVQEIILDCASNRVRQQSSAPAIEIR